MAAAGTRPINSGGRGIRSQGMRSGGYNNQRGNGTPARGDPCSLSRRGADLLKPEACRPSLLSPDMLLARTHGADFSSGKGGGRRPLTASSLWSSPSPPETPATQAGRSNAAASSGPAPDKRFYMTAPAKSIGLGTVEEATGVRLSKDQLQALRKRYQGGFSRLSETQTFGEQPNEDDLRQEVFGSLVLRPGQWPKFGNAAPDGEPPSRQGTGQRQRVGNSSLPAAPASSARRGLPGRQPRGAA